MILYGKIRYRLFMKIDLYDTFRILEEKGYFGNPINGALKNETPMQESAYRRSKIGSFLYFSFFHCDRGASFCNAIAKNWGIFADTIKCLQKLFFMVKRGRDCLWRSNYMIPFAF